MASLTWAMVTDATGQVAEVMHVPNRASKGKRGGRTLPLHPDLQAALVTLQIARGDMATPERPILFSERGWIVAGHRTLVVPSAVYLAQDGWLFVALGAGPSLRVPHAKSRRSGAVSGTRQELAGDTSLAMTQRYIEGDTEAKRKLVALL